MVSVASVVEILVPFLADEIAVGQTRIDTGSKEQSRINLSISPTVLFQLELPRLSSMSKEQRKGNTLVSDTKHKDIDVDLTEFPVGAVKAQTSPVLTGRRAKYHFWR